MTYRSKYTIEQKIQACEDWLSGTRSISQIATSLGMLPHSCKAIYRWVDKYRIYGSNAFMPQLHNKSYTKKFKTQAVEAFLSGKKSIREIVTEYDIGSYSLLQRWIKEYNAGKELKDYFPKPEVYMAEAKRKTTIEERKEIVEYCISHNRNYKETATIYKVSYNQVYTWVKKYDSDGETGLIDKRGIHKTYDEVDELERLRRENARLKRQIEEKDMLAELLKKAQEFERM